MKTRLLVLSLVFCGFLAAQETEHNKYFSSETVTQNGETIFTKDIISGPPTPPPGIQRNTTQLPEPDKMNAVNTLSGVPAFSWCFGCSATSAAMIAGYYDRHGYDNMYVGPTNSGIMPLDNSSWGTVAINSETRAQCPLSATRNGVDGRSTNGHVDDYWISYGSSDDDPFITNGWTEHTYEDCTADFMKTNQSGKGNTDGSTTFYSYTNGMKVTAEILENAGSYYSDRDGGYGFKLFYESRGYTVTEMYNQYIYDASSAPSGFTFEQYKAEIDAGRPVMIHVQGHTMVGIGYDDATNLMYIHDTWDYSTHTMTWGGYYSGMLHYAVTIVKLDESEIDVAGNSNSIQDDDNIPSTTDDTDFGVVSVGNTVSHEFTITNSGDYELQLTGSPIVTVSGSGDFTISSQPSDTSLAVGESTTFTVQFNPSSSGIKEATVSIENTDLNESAYNFDVRGADVTIISFGDGSGYTQSVTPNTVNQVLGCFQLTANIYTAYLTEASIKLDGTRTGLSNLKLWYSNNDTFDSGSDTQIGSTVGSDPGDGNSAAFSGMYNAVSTTPGYYFITADLASDAEGNVQCVIADNSCLTISGGTLDGTISNAPLSEGTAPLPVELTAFSAKCTLKNVELNWKTATEVNNYGFEVERSTGKGEWLKVGFVEGAGNSNTAKSYSFSDNLDLTHNLTLVYRLKQIDIDGKFTYSKEIMVEALNATSVPDEFSLAQNYPNPFNPTTTIKYSIPNVGARSIVPVQLKVYNLLGQEVATLVNEQKVAGTYQVKFDAGDLASGIYLYKLSAGEFSSVKKLILMK